MEDKLREKVWKQIQNRINYVNECHLWNGSPTYMTIIHTEKKIKQSFQVTIFIWNYYNPDNIHVLGQKFVRKCRNDLCLNHEHLIKLPLKRDILKEKAKIEKASKELHDIEWKLLPLDDFNHYEVSKVGLVRNANTKHIIATNKKIDGYIGIVLSYNTKKRTRNFLVHRLVALTYIANPNNKPTVNHIDRVRDNNDVKNLDGLTLSSKTIILSNFRKKL